MEASQQSQAKQTILDQVSHSLGYKAADFYCFFEQMFWVMILFLQYITVSAFSSHMIIVNSRKDERISQCFPNDPYSNICIVTASQKLHLQHAFLSMDSGYFARIDPDALEVDLRELQEQPLVRILHSLYGEELVVNSIGELAQLLPVILYLEIQQYRKNIEKEILSKKNLLENVQLIQIAFRHKFLWQEVFHTHLENNLSLLQSTKSYLQLGKIENDTFNYLISVYVQQTGGKNERILNNVMENYFNRKNLKAIPYLQSHNLTHLLRVWMNYHHVFQISTPISPESTAKKIENKTAQLRILQKKRKIQLMEAQIASRNSEINKLAVQIQAMKIQMGMRQKLTTAKSLFINPDQTTQTPSSKQKLYNQRRSKLSPAFQSCISPQTNLQEKRSASKRKTFNRFGSKNAKRWT